MDAAGSIKGWPVGDDPKRIKIGLLLGKLDVRQLLVLHEQQASAAYANLACKADA